MNTCKDSGTVRGLAIATLVLTILCLLSCLLIIPFTNMMTEYANSNQDEIAAQLEQSLEATSTSADVTITGTQIEIEGVSYDAVALIAGFFYAVFAIIVILNVIVLIGNILAIVNAEKPKKLMAAFVLAIIGAVFCFCMGAWVRCVLEIVLAVYISKVRSWGNLQAAAAAQPGVPGAPTGAGPQATPGNQDMPNILR